MGCDQSMFVSDQQLRWACRALIGLFGIAVMMMVMASCHRLSRSDDRMNPFRLSNSPTGVETGDLTASHLTAASLASWNPQSQADYITAIRSLNTQIKKIQAGHSELTSYLSGTERVFGCVLKIPPKKIVLKVSGTHHDGDSLSAPSGHSEVDEGHRMVVYLGEYDDTHDLVVSGRKYELFRAALTRTIQSPHREIKDIKRIKIKQIGGDYFGGQPFTIRSIELRVGSPHEILIYKNDQLNFELGEDGAVLEITESQLKHDDDYAKMMARDDCGST